MFVRVGFSRVAIEVEGFPLGRERGVSDKIGKRVAASGLVRGGNVGWGWVVDHSRKGGCDVMRRDVGCGKILWVVGWNVCGVESGGYVMGSVGG